MSTPIPGVAAGAAKGGPARDRLVGLGLALVVLGWVALVADLALAATQLQPGGLVAVLSLKNDVATLSETLIVTGLGLALLGGLREGFGALDRFFGAVLHRSAAGRPQQAAVAPEPAPVAVDDDGLPAPRRAAPDRAFDRPIQPAPGRNYQILPDGSVEVETLLGTRVFASMEEARDFIR